VLKSYTIMQISVSRKYRKIRADITQKYNCECFESFKQNYAFILLTLQ